MPSNYVALVKQSLLASGSQLHAGDNLLYQLLTDGIYSRVARLTRIEILSAYSESNSSAFTPGGDSEYSERNVMVTRRRKILLTEGRIAVVYDEDP